MTTTCRRCHRAPAVKPWPPLCAACLAVREREDRALAADQPRIESRYRADATPMLPRTPSPAAIRAALHADDRDGVLTETAERVREAIRGE